MRTARQLSVTEREYRPRSIFTENAIAFTSIVRVYSLRGDKTIRRMTADCLFQRVSML